MTIPLQPPKRSWYAQGLRWICRLMRPFSLSTSATLSASSSEMSPHPSEKRYPFRSTSLIRVKSLSWKQHDLCIKPKGAWNFQTEDCGVVRGDFVGNGCFHALNFSRRVNEYQCWGHSQGRCFLQLNGSPPQEAPLLSTDIEAADQVCCLAPSRAKKGLDLWT